MMFCSVIFGSLTLAPIRLSPFANVSFGLSDGALCVEAKIGGRPLWFFLDSGDAESYIDPTVAAGLKDKMDSDELGDGFKKTYFLAPTVDVGGIEFHNKYFREEALRGVGEQVEGSTDHIAGILGFDILRLCTVAIDFQNWSCGVWPPDRLKDAEVSVFGCENEGVQLATIKVTPEESQPVIDSKIGQIRCQTILDLGSWIGFVSDGVAKNKQSGVTTAVLSQIDTATGRRIQQKGLVETLGLGTNSWSLPAFLVSGSRENTPNVIGWTMFVPCRRVVLDFSGGSVIVPRGIHSFSFLETWLSQYNATVTHGGIQTPARFIPGRAIRSICGIPVPRSRSILDSRIWPPGGARCRELLGLYWVDQPTIRYIKNHKLKSECLQFLARPPLAPTQNGQGPCDTFNLPGVYLRWNNKWSRLDEGEVWIPRGQGKLLSVGATDAPSKVASKGEYDRWIVPRSRERMQKRWALLGWPIQSDPVILQPDGKVTLLRSQDPSVPIPSGSAFAAGTRTVRFVGGVPVSLDQPGPKSPSLRNAE